MSEDRTKHLPDMPTGSVVEEHADVKWIDMSPDGGTETATDAVTAKPRTEDDIRSHADGYNAGTEASQLIHEQVSSAMNWQTIRKAYIEGRAKDMHSEPKSTLPAIIIGSGPSLDHSIKFLKDWKGGIFCSTSHATTLIHHGIEPTHIVVLDPFCYWGQLKGVDWVKTRTKLITNPGVWPDLITNWPGPMLLYLQNPDRADSFYMNEQKNMYTWREHEDPVKWRGDTFHFMIRTWFPIFACTPAMELLTADFLGYGPLYLCGVDFGYSHGKERFTEWKIDEKGEWKEYRHPYKPNPNDIIARNKIPTADVHLYYKKNFISAWRMCMKTMYTTDHGIMPEIPYVDIEKVVRHQGKGIPEQAQEKIAHISEKYLASVGAFVINTKRGPKFIECEDPWTMLPQWMAAQNRVLLCGNCKVTANINNDSPIDDMECPNCHQKKLERLYGCNIRENMLRIDQTLRQLEKAK